MHHEDIKAALRKQGVNLRAIALAVGVAPNTLSKVARGRVRTPVAAEAIATCLGTTKEKLWPELYAKPTKVELVKTLLKKAA